MARPDCESGHRVPRCRGDGAVSPMCTCRGLPAADCWSESWPCWGCWCRAAPTTLGRRVLLLGRRPLGRRLPISSLVRARRSRPRSSCCSRRMRGRCGRGGRWRPNCGRAAILSFAMTAPSDRWRCAMWPASRSTGNRMRATAADTGSVRELEAADDVLHRTPRGTPDSSAGGRWSRSRRTGASSRADAEHWRRTGGVRIAASYCPASRRASPTRATIAVRTATPSSQGSVNAMRTAERPLGPEATRSNP